MQILLMKLVVKSSGGDRVYEPNLKSLAKVDIGRCADHEIFLFVHKLQLFRNNRWDTQSIGLLGWLDLRTSQARSQGREGRSIKLGCVGISMV